PGCFVVPVPAAARPGLELPVTIGLSGGEGMRKVLLDIQRKAGTGELLRLGFLEGATYPDGTPVAYIAAINEFGGSFQVEARQQTIYRRLNADGSFASDGKFVKASKSNFATEHTVPAHTVTVPPRPFFRQMIAEKSPSWGASMAKVLKAAGCDVRVALGRMGEGIR